MKLSRLSTLAFLGVAHASVQPATFKYVDEPSEAYPLHDLLPCQVPDPSLSVKVFQSKINAVQAYGPCRFSMKRTYRGTRDEMEKAATMNETHMSVVFELFAPKGVATYLEGLFMEGEELSDICNSAELSPWDAKDPTKRRYLPRITKEKSRLNQLEGGRYVFDTPLTCWKNLKGLTLMLKYTYEDVTAQSGLIKHGAKVFQTSKNCPSPDTSKAVDSYKEYRKYLKTLPAECRTRFERSYNWILPASHLLVETEQTTVVAQIALTEPMSIDHTRKLTELKLRHLKGEKCYKTLVFARKKSADTPRAVTHLESADMVVITESNYGDNLIARRKMSGDGVSVAIPEAFSHMDHDFLFVLQPDCEFTEPLLEMRVVDESV